MTLEPCTLLLEGLCQCQCGPAKAPALCRVGPLFELEVSHGELGPWQCPAKSSQSQLLPGRLAYPRAERGQLRAAKQDPNRLGLWGKLFLCPHLRLQLCQQHYSWLRPSVAEQRDRAVLSTHPEQEWAASSSPMEKSALHSPVPEAMFFFFFFSTCVSWSASLSTQTLTAGTAQGLLTDHPGCLHTGACPVSVCCSVLCLCGSRHWLRRGSFIGH